MGFEVGSLTLIMVILGLSAIGKLLGPDEATTLVPDVLESMPYAYKRAIVQSIASVELLLGVLVFPRGTRRYSLPGIFVMSLLFAVVAVIQMAGGDSDCGCFGVFQMLNTPVVRAAAIMSLMIGSVVHLLRQREDSNAE